MGVRAAALVRVEVDEDAPVLAAGPATPRGHRRRDLAGVAVGTVLLATVTLAVPELLGGLAPGADAVERTGPATPPVLGLAGGDPAAGSDAARLRDADRLRDAARSAVADTRWCVVQLTLAGDGGALSGPDAVYLGTDLEVDLVLRAGVELGRAADGRVVGVDHAYRRWWVAGADALTADPVVAAAVTGLRDLLGPAHDGAQDGVPWVVADPALPSLWTTVGTGAGAREVEVVLDATSGLPVSQRVTRSGTAGPVATQVMVSWLPCDTATRDRPVLEVPAGYRGTPGRGDDAAGQDVVSQVAPDEVPAG